MHQNVFEDFQEKHRILQHIKDLHSSQNTAEDSAIKMSGSAQQWLKMDLHSCTYFPVCLNEKRDIIYSACLALTLFLVNDNKVCEELFKLATWSGTTGLDITSAAVNALSEPQRVLPK
jgi:hypothetical protein